MEEKEEFNELLERVNRFALLAMVIVIGFALFIAGGNKMAKEVCENMDLVPVVRNKEFLCITQFEFDNPKFGTAEQEFIKLISNQSKYNADKLFVN